MHKLPIIFSMLSVFSAGVSCVPIATPSASTPKQNDPSIVEGANAYLKAVVAGDARGIVKMFGEDAILMPPHRQLLRGKFAIQQYYENWCQSPMKPASFSFDHFEASVSGDFAYDVGTYRTSFVSNSGQGVDDTGKYTAILKRSAGEWKIAYLIFNSDLLEQSQAIDTPK